MALLNRLPAAVLVVLASASILFADPAPGIISGTVFAIDGSRLPGAFIRVTGQETGQVFRATSGERGICRVAGLPHGRRQILCEIPGFEPKTADVILREGGAEDVDFVLRVALSVSEVVTVIGCTRSTSRTSATRSAPGCGCPSRAAASWST